MVLISGVGFGQDFGRFGYRTDLDLPGFRVNKDGFQIDQPMADLFRFAEPASSWKAVSTRAEEQVIFCGAATGAPSKIRANMRSAGFEVYVGEGLSLKLSSLRSPFLTWNQGSVGETVPTPSTNWVLASFRDNQPPILFGFENGTCGLVVNGAAGEWKIETTKPYVGWIRIVAPRGVRSFRTNNVGELGGLLKEIKPFLDSAAQPPPQLVSKKISGDQSGITVIWTFDRPGAIVPAPVHLAPIGGYPIEVKSKIEVTSAATEEGPIAFCREPRLVLRMAHRLSPIGRPITIGAPDAEAIGTISPLDQRGVAEMAAHNILGLRSAELYEAGLEAKIGFLEQATYAQEPFTGQKLPFSGEQPSLELAAAHAWLEQQLQLSNDDGGAILESVALTQDPYSWMLGNAPSSTLHAYLALGAGANSGLEERLLAATAQAVLSADVGLQLWAKRREIVLREPAPEPPFFAMRNALYNLNPRPDQEIVPALRSGLRIIGRPGFTCLDTEEGLVFVGQASAIRPIRFRLISEVDLAFTARENTARLTSRSNFGEYEVVLVPESPGEFRFVVHRPNWAPKLPKTPSMKHFQLVAGEGTKSAL